MKCPMPADAYDPPFLQAVELLAPVPSLAPRGVVGAQVEWRLPSGLSTALDNAFGSAAGPTRVLAKAAADVLSGAAPYYGF